VMVHRQAEKKVLKVLAIIGIVFGVVISYATGSGYMMSSQPYWNTPLMPLSYLCTAAAFGSSIYLAFVATWKGDADAKAKAVDFASKCAIVAALVAAVMVTIYAVALNAVFVEGTPALYALCLIGCLGVLACGFATYKKPTTAVPAVGVVCGVVASLGFRCFMFAAGTGMITLIASPDVVNHFFATI
jgi:DMSO reductase anchor subunit